MAELSGAFASRVECSVGSKIVKRKLVWRHDQVYIGYLMRGCYKEIFDMSLY